jgi:hypothetical protein
MVRSSPAAVRERRIIVARLIRQRSVVGGVSVPKFSGARAIAAELQRVYDIKCHERSVRRDLATRGYRNVVRPCVPTRSADAIKKKREFARREIARMRKGGRVPHFSDESWMTTGENNLCRTQWIRHRRELIARERKARRNCISMQVWGVVGLGFRHLKILPMKRVDEEGDEKAYTLNNLRYKLVCLKQYVQKVACTGVVFMQDNARPHVHSDVMSYLMAKGITCLDWPASSPEMNPIERIWSILKRRVAAHGAQTAEQLKLAITTSWNEIPQEVIDKTVMSYHRALERAARGDQ